MLALQKGLTLVEVLTVVAMMTILSAISYTQYRQYIRKGRQLEAKTNLGVVYQKQLSYLSSERQFSPSLRTIGAVPIGRIRYNIGTDWNTTPPHDESHLTRGNSVSDLCPCHNDQKNSNIPSHSCWADPNPELISDSCSDTHKCYGDSSNDMHTQMGPLSNIPHGDGGFELNGGKFEYYAIGCTHPGTASASELDVWSITHKKSLKNIRSGL